MKKVIALGLVLVSMMGVLASCGGTFECDLCGEEKKGKQYKEKILEEEVIYCKECHDGLEELEEGLKDLAS